MLETIPLGFLPLTTPPFQIKERDSKRCTRIEIYKHGSIILVKHDISGVEIVVYESEGMEMLDC